MGNVSVFSSVAEASETAHYVLENHILLRHCDAVGQRYGDPGKHAQQGYHQGDGAKGEAEAARNSRNLHPEAHGSLSLATTRQSSKMEWPTYLDFEYRC